MAYMYKELKNEIVAEVKKVLPKNWKASFAIRNLSTIVMTISKADFVLEDFVKCTDMHKKYGHMELNVHNLDKCAKSEELNQIFKKIGEALNCKNHDNSDAMTDYFDVGYYVDIQIGSYKKSFTTI